MDLPGSCPNRARIVAGRAPAMAAWAAAQAVRLQVDAEVAAVIRQVMRASLHRPARTAIAGHLDLAFTWPERNPLVWS